MKRSIYLAAAVAIGAVAWIATGDVDLSARVGHTETEAQETEISPASPAGARPGSARDDTAVRARLLTATPHQRTVVARGRTESIRTVELRAEVKGRISKLAVAKGAVVKKGQVIARLDIEDRKARLAEAKALVRQRQIEYDAAQKLQQKGFRSDTKVAAAAAYLDAAKAMVVRMQVALDRTAIRAPFAGFVEDRHVEIGGFVDVGQAVARLVDLDPFLVIAQVSEHEVGRLAIGDVGRAELATGQVVDGRIRYISSTADSATRTFRMELEVPNPKHDLRAGVTAKIFIADDAIPAHFVSPAILTLNDEGRIGIRAVDDDNRVVFHPVEVIADSPDGIWLGGLPATCRVITVGQEFVREGDKVRVIADQIGQAS